MLPKYPIHPLVSILLAFIVEITSHLLPHGVPLYSKVSSLDNRNTTFFFFTKDDNVVLGQPIHAQYNIIIYSKTIKSTDNSLPLIFTSLTLKLNHEVNFSLEGKEILHTSSSKLGTISNFLIKDADTNECDAPESIRMHVEV